MNFFVLNGHNTLRKMNFMVTEIITNNRFSQHPLQWQSEVPKTFEELASNPLESIAYQKFDRRTGLAKSNSGDLTVARKMQAMNPLFVN